MPVRLCVRGCTRVCVPIGGGVASCVGGVACCAAGGGGGGVGAVWCAGGAGGGAGSYLFSASVCLSLAVVVCRWCTLCIGICIRICIGICIGIGFLSLSLS